MRHVVVMSFTSSIGIMAIYVVDLLDIFFISLLGVDQMTAAAGYASTILFFVSAISIGLSVAAGSLVARALGSGRDAEAKEITTACVTIAAAVGVAIPILLLPVMHYPLSWLGAPENISKMAQRYMWIVLPATFLSGMSMSLVASLRSYGEAKRAMYPSLAGAAVNFVFDPILIFGLGLGLEGAATATVLARIMTFALAYYYCVKIRDAAAPFRVATVRKHARTIMGYAWPAVFSSVAAPVGQAILMRFMAKFGTEAVASIAIVGRVAPVVFSVINALSGSIGPIIGQNAGAGLHDRVRQAYYDSLKFLFVYVVVAILLLALLDTHIVDAFKARGLTRELLLMFFGPYAIIAFFNGSIFISNAAFNNLGHPNYSPRLNWAKSTIGLLPFLAVGGAMAGAFGVVYGLLANAIVFAAISAYLTMKIIDRSKRVEQEDERFDSDDKREHALLNQTTAPIVG